MKLHICNFSSGASLACGIAFVLILSMTISYAHTTFEVTPGVLAPTNEIHLLKYVIPVLKKAQTGGRINFVATNCGENIMYLGSFPAINVKKPTKYQAGVLAIREMLLDNINVKVRKGSYDVIVIDIGAVPDRMLRTKISFIRFTPIEQYNPSLAIPVIANTKSVRAAVSRYGFHSLPIPFDHALVNPASGLPHLPELLTNVTMNQAFDTVARTFGGIVVYGVCPKSRLYTVSFLDPRGFNDAR